MASVHTTRDGTATKRFATSSMYGRTPPGGPASLSGISNGRRKASDLLAPAERTRSPSGSSKLTAWCVACGAFAFTLFALTSAQQAYSRFVDRQYLPSCTRQNAFVDAVSQRPKMSASANLTGNPAATSSLARIENIRHPISVRSQATMTQCENDNRTLHFRLVYVVIYEGNATYTHYRKPCERNCDFSLVDIVRF
ncbi:hypothetical protein HPB50_012803 [Hyalomma asiaticum]|uniref:Uncharacterized protein n=1 Tax=Hyalomma asiaticum TaxID=266040 RepID=A0ACB7SMU2_HYAAI|nr:hypothetical protein HPB50_012803 [Hyalomma asiaticum]